MADVSFLILSIMHSSLERNKYVLASALMIFITGSKKAKQSQKKKKKKKQKTFPLKTYLHSCWNITGQLVVAL